MSRRRHVSREECLALVDRYLPRGWVLVERETEENSAQFRDDEVGMVAGVCDLETKTISSIIVEDRESLFVFLHEVGHATFGRLSDEFHRADEEFEAEMFAILAMRGLGFAVPRHSLRQARKNVRDCLKLYGHDASDDALKFAYGKNWRDYR